MNGTFVPKIIMRWVYGMIMDGKIELINKLRFGNEIEAIQAVRALKSMPIDSDLFRALCYNYLFSEIGSVQDACGNFLGKNGRLRAHAMFFKGEIQ